MGLKDSNSIDLITNSLNPREPGLWLLIVDGDRMPNVERWELMKLKLTAYASYLFGGSFEHEHPEVALSQVRIKVLWVEPPLPEMSELRSVRNKQGVKVSVDVESYQEFRRTYGLG